jgi:hypothetical protein
MVHLKTLFISSMRGLWTHGAARCTGGGGSRQRDSFGLLTALYTLPNRNQQGFERKGQIFGFFCAVRYFAFQYTLQFIWKHLSSIAETILSCLRLCSCSVNCYYCRRQIPWLKTVVSQINLFRTMCLSPNLQCLYLANACFHCARSLLYFLLLFTTWRLKYTELYFYLLSCMVFS